MGLAREEENRKVRYLRLIVDLSLSMIREGEIGPRRADRIVDEARSLAGRLFPGKETVFDIIYAPRFRRAIEDRFGPAEEPAGGRES